MKSVIWSEVNSINISKKILSMHPKVISDKTLKKILCELTWIAPNIMWRSALKFMSTDILF